MRPGTLLSKGVSELHVIVARKKAYVLVDEKPLCTELGGVS